MDKKKGTRGDYTAPVCTVSNSKTWKRQRKVDTV